MEEEGFDVLIQMDQVLEMLKLLNYEAKFCR